MSTEEQKEETTMSTLDLEKEVEASDQEAASVKDQEAVIEDVEAEKRGGTKEVATNNDAIAIEKDMATEADGQKQDALPSFFVKKSDRHRVEVDILSSKRDGKVMSISRTGLGLDFQKDFQYLKHTEGWFEFSLPNYEDMTTYRQRSAVYRREAQQMIVDKLQLRYFILVWHLKDWSLTDSNGNKVELKHEETGALTDASISKVYAVMPTLVDVIMTIFEKDILLTA